MPISDNTELGYRTGHWKNVYDILTGALAAHFETKMVSAADETTVIQKTIVESLYLHELVVCDVSSRNPNVMFELGMRLTWDKPVVVIIDDITTSPFDTSPIERLIYPSDLRYADIDAFKEQLAKKAVATFEASKGDENYSPFLKHFSRVQVAPSLDKKELAANEYLGTKIDELTAEIQLMKRLIGTVDSFGRIQAPKGFKGGAISNSMREIPGTPRAGVRLRKTWSATDLQELTKKLHEKYSDTIASVFFEQVAGSYTVTVEFKTNQSNDFVIDEIVPFVRNFEDGLALDRWNGNQQE